MNIIGIDFEDWFHPQLVQNYITGMKREPTVIKGIEKILDLLRINETYATFFVVGELLEHDPTLIDRIIGEGHEIGFHTMHHTRLNSFDSKEIFLQELDRFDRLTNQHCKGFRAPTFSLDHNSAWVIDALVEQNYLYDSSVVPIKTRLYGLKNADRKPYKISSSSLDKNDPVGKLLEFPIATGKFLGKQIPTGGGFYLRFLPMNTIKKTILEYEKQNIPATFYIHSWELTPEFMPRIKMSFKDSFITYHNIKSAYSKIDKLLRDYEFTSFARYISKLC